MNKKFLLAAMALPLAFTACTEDFNVVESESNETYVDGDKIRLSDDFVLSASRSESASSRASWVTGGTDYDGATGTGTQFMWIPKSLAANEALTDFNAPVWANYAKDAVGLCYVHGGEIMTNYKFDHDGWVEWGQEFSNIPFKCEEGVRYYERTYLRYTQLENASANFTAIEGGADGINNAVKATLNAPVSSAILVPGDKDRQIEELNLARGIFKTGEKTIFKGDYIAYYPWTNGMLEAGNLTATVPVKMTYENGDYDYRVNALNKYTFAAGWVGNIDGGTEAAEMQLNWVSKLLKVSFDFDGSTFYPNKLILLDPQGNFINKMELTPEQVKAGNYKGTAVEKSQTIMIDFQTTIEDYCYLVGETWTHGGIYVPTFETTIPAGSYILAVDANTGTTQAYQTVDACDFTNVGLAKSLTTTCVDLAAFDYDVVTNEAELIAANATLSDKPILLLGDIELNDHLTTLTKEFVGYIDGVKVGSLVLPAADASYNIYATGAKFDCDVLVQAPGCCHNYGGVLFARDIELKADRTITNENSVTFFNGQNKIYGTFENKPYVTPDAEGLSYVAIQPELNIYKRTMVYVYGTMNNLDAEDIEGNNIQSVITIASDDAISDKKDGELSVVKTATTKGLLNNDATIINYGTMSNQTGVQAQILNNEGATYVLKIGGQLTGALLKNAENRRCDFIAEVDNAGDSRWSTAWSQGLANIIKIVATQNPEFTTPLDYIYPFQFTLNSGDEMTVNNKNVQVIVENPDVKFVGKKTTGEETVFTPVAATIGRLLINHTNYTAINTVSQYSNNATYKTILPLQLKVDASNWAGNECAAGNAENAINVVSGLLVHNNYSFKGLTALKSVRLSVVGDFDVIGSYTERAYLSQTGTLAAQENGKILFDQDSRFNIAGNIISADAQDDENHGIFFEERVIGSLTGGNMYVEEKSFIQVAGDGVITVNKNVENDGKMKWISRTGTKSPGIVYCSDFNASNPANWVNGTPTLK